MKRDRVVVIIIGTTNPSTARRVVRELGLTMLWSRFDGAVTVVVERPRHWSGGASRATRSLLAQVTGKTVEVHTRARALWGAPGEGT